MVSRCIECLVMKLPEEFYLNSRGHRRTRCKACQIADVRAWRADNIERWKATVKARYAANRGAEADRYALWLSSNLDRRNKYNATWRKNNPALAKAQRDRHAVYRSEWARSHPEHSAAKSAKRRAGKSMATPGWANGFFIGEAYDLAKRRSEASGFKWHVDHIVPLISPIVCGLHCESNLAVIPAAHNIIKSNALWPNMP